jgi:hypothetical protein
MHHESQFLNVDFLAKQFFGILRSQMKIEWVFSLVGLLTTPFQVENMDWFIIVVKN